MGGAARDDVNVSDGAAHDVRPSSDAIGAALAAREEVHTREEAIVCAEWRSIGCEADTGLGPDRGPSEHGVTLCQACDGWR